MWKSHISRFPNFQIELGGLGTSDDARCVYCRTKPADPAWRPFCSERCKMADLGRWLTGGYTVPGEPPPEEPDPING
jgi:uncharacterized protein